MRFQTLKDQYDWKEIQAYYDNNRSWYDVMRQFNLDKNKLHAAVKQGLFISRARKQTYIQRGTVRQPMSDQARQNISNGMQRAVKEGRHKVTNPYGLRCKKIWHTNWQGEKVFLLGGWEQQVALFLDKNHIPWTRPKTGYRYIWQEKEHRYFPDFYLPDQDIYLEVKGYRTARDEQKWLQFPGKLMIIDRNNIHKLQDTLPFCSCRS